MGRPRKPEGTRVSDVVAIGVRLQPDLRSQLEREAAINGRSLSAEILARLRASLDNPELANRLAHARAMEVGSAFLVAEPPPQGSPVPPLGDAQRMLLSLFAALPPDKQLALLTFLRR